MAAVDAIDGSLQAENEMVRVHTANNERELTDGEGESIQSPERDDDVRQLIAGDNVIHHHHPKPDPSSPPPLPQQPRESNLLRNLLIAAAIGGTGLGGVGLGSYLTRRPSPDPDFEDTRFEPFILPIQPQ